MDMGSTAFEYLSEYYFERSDEEGIGNFWHYIKNENSEQDFKDTEEIFIRALELIWKFGLADFYAPYDKGEVRWEGEIIELIDLTKKFISQNKNKIIDSDSNFYHFKYCFIKWKNNSDDIDWCNYKNNL